jgi:hypothetical protein
MSASQPDFVGVSQKRAHETFVEGLQADDVLAIGQDDAADGYLVHAADGLADHRKGVVSDFAVGDQVIRTDGFRAPTATAASRRSSTPIFRRPNARWRRWRAGYWVFPARKG